MMRVTALGVLALTSLGATQTYTACNPTESSCPICVGCFRLFRTLN